MAVKIPALIFCYGGDALPMRECVRGLLTAGLMPVVMDDKHAPLPRHAQAWIEAQGGEYRQTKFKRNGNLNGVKTSAYIAWHMHDTCERHRSNIAIKIDADTIIHRPALFSEMSTGIYSTTLRRREAFGCCYSLQSDVAYDVSERLFRRYNDTTVPEDVTIWREVIAHHEHQMLDFSPHHGPFSAVPLTFDPLDCLRFDVLTFGNRPTEGWKDRSMQIYNAMKRFNDYNFTLAKYGKQY